MKGTSLGQKGHRKVLLSFINTVEDAWRQSLQ